MGMKSWWEKGCVVQLPSLSLSHSFTHSLTLKTYRSRPCLEKGNTHTHTRAHTNSLNMRIQNYHLNKKDKNGLLCFIRLGKQQKKRKKKKHCADWYITDTNQPSHISHARSHSYTFTKIFTSITNPICLIFFVVFVISFLGKCKSSSFFYNPFFNSFTFYINVKKMLNKRNINSVCLSRKDLLSDKVSTKGPPDFENLDHSPHQLCRRPPSSSGAHAHR